MEVLAEGTRNSAKSNKNYWEMQTRMIKQVKEFWLRLSNICISVEERKSTNKNKIHSEINFLSLTLFIYHGSLELRRTCLRASGMHAIENTVVYKILVQHKNICHIELNKKFIDTAKLADKYCIFVRSEHNSFYYKL